MSRKRYVQTLTGDRRACVADYLRHVSFWELLRDWRLIRALPANYYRLAQALDDPFGPDFPLSAETPS